MYTEGLATLDWIIIAAFFLLMIAIGIWANNRNKNTADYFTAGGKIPWWLLGFSHHVSGYSGAVFVAYAGLAYTHGFSIYVWWALTIGIGILLSRHLFPPLWHRLRQHYHIQSPLEYLSIRYGVPTQQLIAWSGVLLKLFDVGAKWAAIAVLLKVFTGLPFYYGVLLSGGVSILYITIGGLWAVTITDFIQFLIQMLAGIAMFAAALSRLGGWDSLFTIWERLAPSHSTLFPDPYTEGFVLAMFVINLFSYNGGNWNLATKYISAPSERDTQKAALLSGVLYLIWPLILFFPMWAAPILLPGLSDPTESYGRLTMELLPTGMTGLVLASMFAATMSMTSSDANTISAVITRDILPILSKKIRFLSSQNELRTAKWATFLFTLFTIVIALQYQSFGGILGLIISWFAALVGPVAIPILLGMLRPFKSCDGKAAIGAILGGFLTFALMKIFDFQTSLAIEVGLPSLVSLLVFSIWGLGNRGSEPKREVEELLKAIHKTQ